MTNAVNTKEKILELGRELFQSQGFHGFSYNDISSALGIKNAAIHYHYPTKEQLGKSIIERASQNFNKWKCLPENCGDDSWSKFNNFIQMYYSQNLKDGNKICLVTSCAVIYNSLPDSIRNEVISYSENIINWLTEILNEGKKEKVFDFKGKPSDKACLIISALAASVQLSRIGGVQFFTKTVEQIKTELQPN